MHPLTPKQAKLLLQVAHKYTGLRQGELLGLKWNSPLRWASPSTAHNLTRRSFKPLLKRAGLPQIRFHDLRHTCATLLLTRNVNPKIVPEMLGHSSVAITLDTYSHVLPNMRDQAAAMEEALS
jgi:integrase